MLLMAQSGMNNGKDVGNMTSFGPSRALRDHASLPTFMHDLHLFRTDLKPEYVKIPYKVTSCSPIEGTCYRRLPKASAIKVIDFGSTSYMNIKITTKVSPRGTIEHLRLFLDGVTHVTYGVLVVSWWNCAWEKLCFKHMRTWSTWQRWRGFGSIAPAHVEKSGPAC
ncbi:hypothetical protein CRYUN_Cryun06bG0128200 [Craigia yunnanensis]